MTTGHNEQHDPASAVVKQNLTTQPAAAQEAVAYCQPDDPLNSSAFSWPGTDRKPSHTTPLYAAPVTAAPVEVIRDDDGEIVMVKQGGKIIASTCHAGGKSPAAPGIDLQWLIDGLDEIGAQSRNLRQGGCDAGDLDGLENGLSYAVDTAHELRDRLLALIDASPKGGETRTPIDGCTESNCPRCRTHPDHRGDMEHAGIGRRPPQDSPKGGSEAAHAEGWRVIPHTSPWREGERWEVYGPNGGGSVNACDIKDQAVRELLDALAGLQASDAEARP